MTKLNQALLLVLAIAKAGYNENALVTRLMLHPHQLWWILVVVPSPSSQKP